MTAPIIVHRLANDGGRRVTAHVRGLDQILGTAYTDVDLVEFLRRVGIEEPDQALDDPSLVEWRGDPAHRWSR